MLNTQFDNVPDFPEAPASEATYRGVTIICTTWNRFIVEIGDVAYPCNDLDGAKAVIDGFKTDKVVN